MAECALDKLKEQLNILFDKDYKGNEMIEHFSKFKNIKILDRKIIVSLIERIEIYENNKTDIKFLYANQYETLVNSIYKVTNSNDFKKISIN